MIKEPSLKKLRNKLLLINLVSLTLVVTIAFSIIYINFYNRTQNEIRQTLYSIPRSIQENVELSSRNPRITVTQEGPGNQGLTIIGEGSIPVDYKRSFIVNISGDGEVSVFSMLNISDETYFHVIESVLKSGSLSGVTEIRGHSWMYSIEAGSGHPDSPYAISIVFLDIDDTNRGLGALLASLIIIGIIAVGVIFLISMLVSNRAIKPVEESMVKQKRFIADASHELKTPIAIISANAEAAGDTNAADRSYWINNIADEANRMNELVDSLLALAKAEEKNIDKTWFNLCAAVNEEADRVEAFLFEKNISFEIGTNPPSGEPISVLSDKAKVQAVLSVLLENAVKYTPAGGKVFVNVTRNNVSVSNTGDLIPAENLAHIFDRFYRVDTSRNSETGGHGIGLSIANEIATALGGRLSAESVPQNETKDNDEGNDKGNNKGNGNDKGNDETGALNTFTFYL